MVHEFLTCHEADDGQGPLDSSGDALLEGSLEENHGDCGLRFGSSASVLMPKSWEKSSGGTKAMRSKVEVRTSRGQRRFVASAQREGAIGNRIKIASMKLMNPYRISFLESSVH